MTLHTTVPLEAYQQTNFIVTCEGNETVVRLGKRSESLDQLLAKLGATSGIFITAWNPFSEQTPWEINLAANERMAADFAERGIRTLEHIGRAPEGDWSEDGFFALDLDTDSALEIARAYNQIAVVHAPAGSPAILLLTGLRRG